MKIIPFYIMRNHVAPFLFGFCTVVFIFLMQFIMNQLDNFVGKGLDEWIIIRIILYNLPWMVVLAAPMGVLFSTLMAFGNMAANYEITIIKSGGVSLIRMMLPVLAAGFLLSLFMFWFNDKVLPESNFSAKMLLSNIPRLKPTFLLEPGKFSTQLEGYVILPRDIDTADGTLRGVTIYDYTRPSVVNIVDADTGRISFDESFSNIIVNLVSGEVHQVPLNSLNNHKRIGFGTYKIVMKASGFSFAESEKSSGGKGDREMKIAEMEVIVRDAGKMAAAAGRLYGRRSARLADIASFASEERVAVADTAVSSVRKRLEKIKRSIDTELTSLRSEAFTWQDAMNRANSYEVEIWKKYSIPFACFIFVFVGCPLGIITRKGNFGVSAAISLGFYLVYWVCLIMGEKMADRGDMSPFFSMWLGDLVIGLIGLAVMIRVNYESFSLPVFSSLFRKRPRPLS